MNIDSINHQGIFRVVNKYKKKSRKQFVVSRSGN